MQKLLILLILSFFSAQGFAASCPDGSEPVKTISADGTYFEYKCGNTNNEQTVSSEMQITINILLEDSPYEELSNDVLNPDRGFYPDLGNANLEFNYYNKNQPYEPFVSAKEFIANNPITDIWDLTQTAPIRKEWLLIDKFYDRDLSGKYLEDLKEYFEDARRHEIKIIPRWNYTNPNEPSDRNHALYISQNAHKPACQIGNCPWKYQTAEIEYMKRHIQQIAPIVNQYKDVISFVEMGFIGAWGEWQDDKYGQPAGKFGGKFGWWHQARTDVVKTWLNNTDDDVYFALRYPSDFIRSEIQELDGFTRVGLHHDCPNYQDDTYPRYNIVAKNAPQGGEFCEIKASNNYSCQTMIKYFETYQFDVLRASYPEDIFNGFQREGCMSEIRNRLGYRFVLMGSSYTDGKLTFVIKNKGFGKSFKSRKLSVKVGDRIIETKIDVKNWKPGNTYLASVDIGTVNSESVCLVIEDAIRFANTSGNEIILNNNVTGKCSIGELPMDFDFSEFKIANNHGSLECQFDIKEVFHDNAPDEDNVRGYLKIDSGKVNIDVDRGRSRWLWRGGLSTDPKYLRDEVNLRLTEDGYLVGKMAYFEWVGEGEPPKLPIYPRLLKHKKSKPLNYINLTTGSAEFWLEKTLDWSDAILYLSNCTIYE